MELLTGERIVYGEDASAGEFIENNFSHEGQQGVQTLQSAGTCCSSRRAVTGTCSATVDENAGAALKRGSRPSHVRHARIGVQFLLWPNKGKESPHKKLEDRVQEKPAGSKLPTID